MRTRSFGIILSALALAACSDRRAPTSPPEATAGPPGPLFAIVDGARGGNPDFFFLPPLQPSPRRNPNFDRGGFNPNLAPTVKICDGRDLTPASECATPLMKGGQPVVFAAVRGWDGLPDWVDPEQYHVLWRTRDYNLTVGHPYRILVKVGGTLLGFLDLVPASRLLGALRISAGGQDIGWLDDAIVPIRFRIERGALCANPQDCTETTVSSGGGDITVPSKLAGLSVPSGAVESGDTVTVVIEREDPQYGGECLPTDIVQSKGCYHFRSDPPGYEFTTQVRMEICVDPQYLTADQEERLRLFKYNTEEGLQQLPLAETSLVDCSEFTAMAQPAASRPSGFAAAALQRLGRFAARLLGPRPLYAARFGGVPKGVGGTGGSFSDVGGAVPSTATQEAVLLTVPASAQVGQEGLVATASGGSGTGAFSYASSTPTICTVGAESGAIAALAAGTCTLTATKAADPVYKAATSEPQSFPVTAGAVAITNVELSSTTLTIDWASGPYVATLVNNTGATLSHVALQGYIEQGDASRAAGGVMLTCTAILGDLPPGSCTEHWGLTASNHTTGSGTLVPGSATARIQLLQDGTELASYTVPVTLVALAPDQVSDAETGTSLGCGYPPFGNLAQSFTPSATTLKAIDLSLRAGGSFPASDYTTTVRVRSGGIAGAIVATSSATVPGGLAVGTVRAVRFIVSPAVALTAGATYVVEWLSPSGGDAVLTWMGTGTDTYAGGSQFSCSGSAGPGDMIFTTWR